MIKQIANLKLKLIFLCLLAFLFSLIAKIDLSIPLFLVVLCVYFKLRQLDFRGYNLLNITFLLLIIFDSSYFILKQKLPLFYIPFSLIPMLVTLLFNNLEISLLITLAISVSVSGLSNNPFQLLLLFLIAGISSSVLALNARKRSTIIRAGFSVGIIEALTLAFIEHFKVFSPFAYLALLVNGIVSSIIVLGILPVFEYLFSTITNISLLELFNHPLLERLKLEAPGTHYHSLIVGNLSESACDAVGANALLARIGSYYHDIGKLQKPGYFSENQNITINKHDSLAPSMSKLIIMNHVREGVDLARKYKLNPALIDFIFQHHGKSLVYYFYRRALEGLEEDRKVQEEGFRYPGPKPNTKETAIVLLADSVEAATRALKDQTPARIEEVVHKVINNKFIDGQLDECDLTLSDLEKISAVFIRILSGMYHSRVTYPEAHSLAKPNDENNHKKFSEKNSPQSEKDKSNNP